MSAEHHLTVSRTARYFTIGDVNDDVEDLWVVCHGYGQLAAPFIETFEVVAAARRLIVAPEGLSRFYLDPKRTAGDANARIGATWMTREDRDHEIADYVRYLDELQTHVRSAVKSAGVRLRVLGFSQGVATVVRWIARGTVCVDELILWAGSFPPDVDVAELRERLGGAPVTVVAGARDQLAPWAGAETQVERLTTAGIAARLVQFGGGHRLDDDTLVAIAAK